MSRINPYLTFRGNCCEAMQFYQRCLGGKLHLQTVEESPLAKQWPQEIQKKILHAELIKDNLILLGSDIGSEELLNGGTISLALACTNEEEMKQYFKNLSQGGKITHPLHKFFEGTIGALTDRYGINWLFKL